MDLSQGAIIAIHCTGKSVDEITNFNINLYSDLFANLGNHISLEQLSASATPMEPNPQFESPDGDDTDSKYDSLMLNNLQFMLLGAFLGIIATLIYWQLSKLF